MKVRTCVFPVHAFHAQVVSNHLSCSGSPSSLLHLKTEWPDSITFAVGQGLKDTTKARDGLQRMPLMMGIGDAVFVNDVSEAEVAAAAAVLRNIATGSNADFHALNSNIVAVPSLHAAVA